MIINYDDNIGLNIVQVRREKGISQAELSGLSGISTSTLSAYENSKKIPNVNTLGRIAISLGVSIDRLYFGDENRAFITSAPDIGRRVVNCVYYLWSQDIISIHEYYHYGQPPIMSEKPVGIMLYIRKYGEQIKRLINLLDEYKHNIKTYNDPEQHLESIKAAVANAINGIKDAGPLGVEDIVAVEPQKKTKAKK